jgi:DNA-binding transcriptional LysR family regulator
MGTKAEFDIRHALCFASVARTKSFTKAAELMGLTQPAVSGIIAKLESQLGFPLFVRESRRVELTAKGEAFFAIALQIESVNTAAQASARELREGPVKRLRFGAPFQSLAIPERAALLDAFLTRLPDVRLEISHGAQPDLLEKLDHDELESALLLRPFDTAGLRCVKIHQSVGHLLVPIEDPLAGRPGLRRSDLAGRPLVGPRRDIDPPCYDWLYAPFAKAGAAIVHAPEGVDHEMERFARLKRLIHLRFGLGQATRKVFGDMVRVPLLDEPVLLEYFVVQRIRQRSAPARAFFSLAMEMFGKEPAGADPSQTADRPAGAALRAGGERPPPRVSP